MQWNPIFPTPLVQDGSALSTPSALSKQPSMVNTEGEHKLCEPVRTHGLMEYVCADQLDTNTEIMSQYGSRRSSYYGGG